MNPPPSQLEPVERCGDESCDEGAVSVPSDPPSPPRPPMPLPPLPHSVPVPESLLLSREPASEPCSDGCGEWSM